MIRPTVNVQEFFKDNVKSLDLKLVSGAGGLQRTIKEPTVNRPGLVLAGHTKYFAFRRVQAFGNAETSYLKTLPAELRTERYQTVLRHALPCAVFCRNQRPDTELLRATELKGIPVFRSSLITMNFINRATLALEYLFAPRATVIGSMVEIHGMGVIIRGDTGIGKSECILSILERGYSLISDDVTKVVLLDGKEIIGSSPEVTRDFMEVRGIGIVNVAALFGARSVRNSKRLDLVVTLKHGDEVEDVDRLGMEEQFTEILGANVPEMVIPVRAGRDLGRLVEVAALQTKLKRTGYNPAKALDRQLTAKMKSESAR